MQWDSTPGNWGFSDINCEDSQSGDELAEHHGKPSVLTAWTIWGSVCGCVKSTTSAWGADLSAIGVSARCLEVIVIVRAWCEQDEKMLRFRNFKPEAENKPP